MKQRQARILELIAENRKIEVSKLSEILEVSQVTIRKDLNDLVESGMVLKEHGFATLNESDDINVRLASNHALKQAIAKEAAKLVRDGETIMLESGSCCTLFALEVVRAKRDVTIITNSAFIANYIRKEGNPNIILLGGVFQNESQVNIGPITKRDLESFHVDKAFIGIDGFTPETGFTGSDFMRAETIKDMARQADHVIVLTDSSKFGRKSLVPLLETEQVSTIITDDGIEDSSEGFLTEKGAIVIKAKS